jgi:cytochrome b6-f complex iron-sulfur subunit
MTTTQTLIVAFAAIGVIAALAIGSIAIRRGGSDGKVGKTDRKAMRRDRAAARAAAPQPAAVAVAHDDGPAPVDPLAEREVLDESSMGVTRRQFFNRGILGIFGLFLAQFGIASLAFMWPKLKPGGFGSKVTAGSAADLFPAVFLPDGRISPLFVPAAQSYLVPFQGDAAGSSFEGLPVIAGQLMALWQRCVHLGCRVPQCDSSQGFECPCHGSRYNYHGEYEGGPAPRNLDRFVVSLDDSGQLVIDTGQVIQTSRASVKTIQYPQGPSCI